MHWKILFLLALGLQTGVVGCNEGFSRAWPKEYYVGFVANSTVETMDDEPSKVLEAFIIEHGVASERIALAFNEVTFPFLTMYVCDKDLVLNSLYRIRGMRSGGVAIVRVARDNIEAPPEGVWRLKSNKSDQITFIPEENSKEFLKLMRRCSAAVDAELTTSALEKELTTKQK